MIRKMTCANPESAAVSGVAFEALCLADPQHGFDGGAAFGIGNGPVDVAEVIELDKAVKRELPCLVQFDQFRDKMLRHGVTLDDAEGFPSFRQRVRAGLTG